MHLEICLVPGTAGKHGDGGAWLVSLEIVEDEWTDLFVGDNNEESELRDTVDGCSTTIDETRCVVAGKPLRDANSSSA